MPLIRKGPGAPVGDTPLDLAAAAVALRRGAASERWTAARALGADPSGAGPLGEALSAEDDEGVREAIFTSLARIGTAQSVDAVLPHLAADDSNLRTGALDALRAMIGAVRPRLPGLLAGPDADVRLLSCELVRDLPSAEAAVLLGPVLDGDPEANVCAAAIDVLAEIGDASAQPALERCAVRFAGQPFLVFAIRTAVDRISTARDPHG